VLGFLLCDDPQWLHRVASHSLETTERRQSRELFGVSVFPTIRRVMESGEALLLPPAVGIDARDAESSKLYALVSGDEAHGLIVAPLLRRGHSLGVVVVSRSHADSQPFDERDRELTSTLADLATSTIARLDEIKALRSDSARASKSRFARLEQVGILGVLVTDLSGRMLEVNDTVLGIVGYSREEVLADGFQWTSLTAPEYVDVDIKAIHDLEQSGVAGLREKQYVRKDGARVWAMVASARIDEDRNISFMLDLTEQKRAEAALRAASERKAADEVRFRLAAIVESSDDAIIGKTLEGIITSWNGGAQRLFGYSPEEAIGRSVSMLMPHGHEDEEAKILARLRLGGVDHFDTVRCRKDGRLVSVSVTSSPVYDSHGALVGASKVARDITARKEAEVQLARVKETAENAVRELEAFSYSVAHDLKAPLRGMNGFAQVLLEKYQDRLDDEAKDWLQEIFMNAKRMGELIDAMLSLAHTTRSPLEREDVDLSAMVRLVAGALLSHEPGRRVEIEVGPSLHASVDRILVHSLIDNLLGNAWKFTRRTAAPKIEFGVIERNGVRAFFVRDNGAGFDMAFAEKLFAPFQRLHRTTDFPGTGIGLANAERIVHRHGGRIWAEGSIDQGATFYFTLPTVSTGDHAEASRRAVDAEARLRRLTVDDVRQQQRRDELEPMMVLRLARLSATIESRRAHGFDLDLEASETHQGMVSYDDLRGRLAILAAEERGLLVMREERAARSVARTEIAEIIGVCVSLPLVVLVVVRLRRENGRRRRSERALRASERVVSNLNKDLEQRVVERTADLERSNLELESFSYSVVHDLRAPLRGMGGFAEILLSENNETLDAQAREHLEEIRQNAAKVAVLIDALVAMSRITRSEMSREHVDLSLLVRQVAGRFASSESRLPLVLSIQENLSAQINRQLVETLVEILIGNSSKFASSGSSARVEFGMTEAMGYERLRSQANRFWRVRSGRRYDRTLLVGDE
jgi:PAS domain S-box-containing protein